MVNIAYQHLRPGRHAQECAEQCAEGCPEREFAAALGAPVLASEIAAERANEERLKAFAKDFQAHTRGGTPE